MTTAQIDVSEVVIIEGEEKGKGRFSTYVMLEFNSSEKTAEQALIDLFDSKARNFDELAQEKKWVKAKWTYPSLEVVENLRVAEKGVFYL